MAHQRPAGLGGAVDDVEHARRQPCLAVDLGEPERGERRQLRGLEHHGVAAGERRRGLPAGDLQGIIPGADAGADAERLAPGVAEGVAAEVDVLAVQSGGLAREVLDAVGAGIDVDHHRLGDRLAGILDLEPGELVAARAQEVGGASEDPPARRTGERRPRAERVLGRSDRPVDVLGSRNLHPGERLPGRRIDRLEGLARARVDRLPADMEPLHVRNCHG
jgi:hypothetical protein